MIREGMIDGNPFAWRLAWLLGTISVVADTLPQQDLIILIDNSQHPDDFVLAKKVAIKLLDHTSVSPATTRVGVIAFGSIVQVIRLLNDTLNRECIVKDIEQIRSTFTSSRTSAILPLREAQQAFEESPRRTLYADQDGSIHSTEISVDRIILLLSNLHHVPNLWSSSESLFLPEVILITVALGNSAQLETLYNGQGTKTKMYHFRIEHEAIIDEVIALGLTQTGVFHDSYTKCTNTTPYQYDECGRRCRCRNNQLTDCFRVRREFTQLSKPERTRYINVFKAHSTDPEFKTSHDNFVKIHGDQFCNGIHRKEYFSPWHRCYLLMFENLLRRLDCRITIPYWDWSYWEPAAWATGVHIWGNASYELGIDGTASQFCIPNGPFSYPCWAVPSKLNNARIMEIIQKLKLIENNEISVEKASNKYLLPCLRRQFGLPAPTVEAVSRILSYPASKFDQFQIILIVCFHNIIHNAIGGNMADNYSSVSPEFYMHHGILDKIWYRWQESSHDRKYVYFQNKTSPMKHLRCPHSQVDLIDSHNLPGCVKITYSIFPTDASAEQPARSGPQYNMVILPNFKELKNCFGFSEQDWTYAVKFFEWQEQHRAINQNPIIRQSRELS